MASNFQAWIDQADMPQRGANGQWIDLETGIAYNAGFDYAGNRPRAARAELSSNAKEARDVAKFFGGKALKGSAKQKEWAEKIRAEKLKTVSSEHAELICEPDNLLQQAKVWIENRNKSGREFAEFVMTYRAKGGEAAKIRAKGASFHIGSHERVNCEIQLKRIVAEYNTLTSAWGF